MSVYMTEAEQLEVIKKWWLRHQNTITLILAVIVMIVAGYRYWNWHMEKTYTQASSAYQSMMSAASSHDDKTTQSFANQLIQNHENSVYATAAHLMLAKIFVNQNDIAKAQSELGYVGEHSKIGALKTLANIRLARILISKKEFDKALTVLTSLQGTYYPSVVNELKGDIYVAKGEYPKALESYKTAINEFNASGLSNRFLDMKNDAVKSMIM